MDQRSSEPPVRHLTSAELAARLGLAKATIEDWRTDGKGPAYIRMGHGNRLTVRYRLADVEAWEESLLVRPGG